jgi:hypothetical protein
VGVSLSLLPSFVCHVYLSLVFILHSGINLILYNTTNRNDYDWSLQFTQHDFVFLPLPPHSPQFNAIEAVWGWLKRKVRQAGPTDHNTLSTAMQTAWEALPQEVIVGFIADAHTHIVGS